MSPGTDTRPHVVEGAKDVDADGAPEVRLVAAVLDVTSHPTCVRAGPLPHLPSTTPEGSFG